MMNDWKLEISRIVYWKQIAGQHDRNKSLPWHLPRVGATQEQISLAERAAGVKFSQEFKEFLSYADGWQGFYVLTDLFGTQEFLAGKANTILQRPELKNFLEANNIPLKETIPIAASDFGLDVFLHFPPNSMFIPGGILWFANEEVERYKSFSDFFAAMVNYNARVAQKMIENEAGLLRPTEN